MKKKTRRPYIPFTTADLIKIAAVKESGADDSEYRRISTEIVLRYAEHEGIFWADTPLLSALLRSEPPENVTLPLSCFYVPTALEGGEESIASVRIRTQAGSLAPPAPSLIFLGFWFASRQDAEGFELLVSWGWEGDKRVGLDSDTLEIWIPLSSDGTVDWGRMALGDEAQALAWVRAIDENLNLPSRVAPIEGDPITAGQWGLDFAPRDLAHLAAQCWRIARNLCAWLTYMPEDVETSAPANPTKVRAEAQRLLESSQKQQDPRIALRHELAAQKQQAHRIVTVGRRIVESLHAEQAFEEGGEQGIRYRVRHVVRGHGRWQPHGKGRQERRWIYIAPHVRGGASLDDPIVPTVKKLRGKTFDA